VIYTCAFQGAELRLYLPFPAVPVTSKFLLVSTAILLRVRYSQKSVWWHSSQIME